MSRASLYVNDKATLELYPNGDAELVLEPWPYSVHVLPIEQGRVCWPSSGIWQWLLDGYMERLVIQVAKEHKNRISQLEKTYGNGQSHNFQPELEWKTQLHLLHYRQAAEPQEV